MNGRRKRRVNQHLMEEKSFSIVKNLLPPAWVIHEYRPDYGIDFSIEPFEPVNGDVSETLGEHLFVQLKSVQSLATKSISVVPRYNVEKRPLKQENAAAQNKESTIAIDVIPFKIDTNDLVTVQAMGAAATVLLVLVALDCDRVFFVCLNDLVDKIVEPEDPEFRKKGTKQVMIPLRNEITNNAESLVPLRLFSKRAKFYTAISKFAYQTHELSYATESVGLESHQDAYKNTLRHFIAVLRALTIWDASEHWPLVEHYRAQLGRLEAILDGREQTTIGIQAEAEIFWQGLNALGRTFEEVSREWFLPTYLSESMR